MTDFSAARAIADAVLYEGYLLFPYTASTRKNQMRWQFGVVVPKAYEAAGTGEHGEQQTEVLVEAAGVNPRVDVLVRFLHVVARTIEAAEPDGSFRDVESVVVDGTKHLRFDETVERKVGMEIDLASAHPTREPFRFEGERTVEILTDASGNVAGRVVRQSRAIEGTLAAWIVPEVTMSGGADAAMSDGSAAAKSSGAQTQLRRVRLRLENHSDVVAAPERAGVLRTAFVSAHTLLGARDGAFLSPIDPPPYAAEATKRLVNQHTWPVLVGDETCDSQRALLVLSSPIVLSDFPRVAPQTDIDAFDATEIDELLTLGVLALSDEERAEARATDPRARAIVERAERFGAAEQAKVHSDSLEALDTPPPQSIVVAGVTVSPGSKVRLHPKRRADAWDMFLVGKTATVRKIQQDLEDTMYVTVTIDDDPASDFHEWYGRSFFFEPDEVEPLGPAVADRPQGERSGFDAFELFDENAAHGATMNGPRLVDAPHSAEFDDREQRP